MPRWSHSSMKCAALSGALREQDAVIGDDPDGIAPDMRPAGDERGAVERLELVELAAVDDAGDDLAYIIGLLPVGTDGAVDLSGIVERRRGLAQRNAGGLHGVEPADDAARDAEGVAVIERVVVGDAGDAAVHVGAAELLGGHDLAGRRLHQRRAAEEDGALVAHDDALVRHRRDIGAARRARAHDDGDLRDAGRRQRRLVVEDAAEMVAVGKDLVLVRQIGAAGIDEIEAGQPVLPRDLLGAQMLLHGDRVVGAALDRGVVGDDDAFAPRDAADAGDDPRRRHVAAIHAVGRELRQLQERRAGIEQGADAIARQQLAAREMALARGGAAALADLCDARPEIGDAVAHRRRVDLEHGRARIDRGLDHGHYGLPRTGASVIRCLLGPVLVGARAATMHKPGLTRQAKNREMATSSTRRLRHVHSRRARSRRRPRAWHHATDTAALLEAARRALRLRGLGQAREPHADRRLQGARRARLSGGSAEVIARHRRGHHRDARQSRAERCPRREPPRPHRDDRRAAR